MNDNEKKNILIGIIMIIVFILIFKGIGSNISSSSSSSSYPKDPSQMTNKQLQEYLDWNEKQNRIQEENQKAFK